MLKTLLSYLTLCSALNGQSLPVLERMFVDDNRIVTLEYDTDPERRYRVDVSADLLAWEEHYLSPFKEAGEGFQVRQVGEFAPSAEYYRLGTLGWRFQSVDTSDDWLGNQSMARLPDGRTAFVYQNRDTNELFFVEAGVAGGAPVRERIEGTGAVDEPGWWDNSGFSDVTLQIGPNGVPHVVCLDDITDEVILLRRSGAAPENWERFLVASDFQSPYWSFTKFAISDQGRMGVVYRGNDGSYFGHAPLATPEAWNSLKISDDSPSNAKQTGLVFNAAGDAIAQAGGWFRIDATTLEATPLFISGQIQSRRGADGSLLSLDGGFNGTNMWRSSDGGTTWEGSYAARQNVTDDGAVSIDCDAAGRLSLFRPPSIYRQEEPGGDWRRIPLRGHAVHLAHPDGRIDLAIIEYDGVLSIATEDAPASEP